MHNIAYARNNVQLDCYEEKNIFRNPIPEKIQTIRFHGTLWLHSFDNCIKTNQKIK